MIELKLGEQREDIAWAAALGKEIVCFKMTGNAYPRKRNPDIMVHTFNPSIPGADRVNQHMNNFDENLSLTDLTFIIHVLFQTNENPRGI